MRDTLWACDDENAPVPSYFGRYRARGVWMPVSCHYETHADIVLARDKRINTNFYFFSCFSGKCDRHGAGQKAWDAKGGTVEDGPISLLARSIQEKGPL